MRWWLCLLALVACDIPTELPKWNPEYALPLPGSSISVAQLLPSNVTIVDGSTFGLSVAPVTFGRSLAQMCPPCVAFDGEIVPKPAFTTSFSATFSLPPDVLGATLVSGWLRFAASNGFSFDPLRPGPGASGSMTVRLLADAQAIGSLTITGVQRAWPPGNVLIDSVAVAGAGSRFAVEVIIDSPAGDPVRINSAASIDVTAAPTQLLLSSAQLRVQDRQVAGQPVQLNLTGIDSYIIDQVQGGKLVLTLSNGFGVGGALTLTVTGSLTPISKQVAIPANDATVEVTFTEAELESMLGREVTVSFSGSVSSASAVTITPAAMFELAVLLVLELGSGG